MKFDNLLTSTLDNYLSKIYTYYIRVGASHEGRPEDAGKVATTERPGSLFGGIYG